MIYLKIVHKKTYNKDLNQIHQLEASTPTYIVNNQVLDTRLKNLLKNHIQFLTAADIFMIIRLNKL